MIRAAMIVLSLAAWMVPANAQTAADVDTRLYMAGIDDSREARAFLARLKSAARSGDRQSLVSMVRYPLTMYDNGEAGMVYENAAALLGDFGSVFTPGVISAIEGAAYENLFVRDQGAMIGDGEIWFTGGSDGILIKAVNPPDAAAGSEPSRSSPGETRGNVLWTQETLNALGYDAGPEDGQIGRRTRGALGSFQRDHGLPVTELADDRTVDELVGLTNVVGPSFDCRKAAAPVERAICKSPILARLDAELAEAYRASREGSPADADLELQRQRAWLARRDQCGSDASCIESSYRERLTALGGQSAGAADFGQQSVPVAVQAESGGLDAAQKVEVEGERVGRTE